MPKQTERFKKKQGQVTGEIAIELTGLLRRKRDAANITQDALAEEMGVTRQTVVSIETGKHLPPLDTLFVYLDSLSYLADKKHLKWSDAFGELFHLVEIPASFSAEQTEAHRDLATILSRDGERASVVRFILKDLTTAAAAGQAS